MLSFSKRRFVFLSIVVVVVGRCTRTLQTTDAFAVVPVPVPATAAVKSSFTSWHHRRRHTSITNLRSSVTEDDTANSTPTPASVEEKEGLPTTESQQQQPPPQQQYTLPELFPAFASSLSALGFSTPTPIQAASATLTGNRDNNVLLMAPTGSGKTLAYLLPALTTAMDDTTDGTVLIVAPTRELALQLAKDAKSLLANLQDITGSTGSTGTGDASASNDSSHEEEAAINSAVQLAIRGMNAPTADALSRASILVGTPPELALLVEHARARDFTAALRVVVLDEVDVLLPPAPKSTRTSLDQQPKQGKSEKMKRDKFGNSDSSDYQEERRKRSQKRKLTALQRVSETDEASGQLMTSTERILRAVAKTRSTSASGGGAGLLPPQILAGSATASRKTVDVLNRVLRNARDGNSIEPSVRNKGDVQVVRPAEEFVAGDGQDDSSTSSSTGSSSAAVGSRAIGVPSQVAHRYVSLSKEAASSADAVLVAVTQASKVLQPKTALLFLCGEFGRSKEPILTKTTTKAPTKAIPRNSKKGKQSRNIQKKVLLAKQKAGSMSGQPDALSARGTCAKLAALGIDAKPLHVALGLEPNAPAEEESGDDATGFFVTFEGAARGLHLDKIDAVFVVGRPASSSSYLHLAGRVGRSSVDSDGGVTIRPGTVVSFCTKGGTKELEKWTKQIGGTMVEELL